MRSDQVAVHLVSDERTKRGDELCHRHQALVQRRERRCSIGQVVRPPEPPAPGAHVPIGQLVDERRDRAAAGGRVVSLQRRGHRGRGLVEARQGPAVDRRPHDRCLATWRPAVRKRRIGDQERVRVPHRPQLPAGLANRVEAEPERLARGLPREQVPTERISAELVEHRPRLDDVAHRLAHLLAVAIQDEPQANDVAIRGLVKQHRRLGMQRVEPPARLVLCLADVVRREPARQRVLARERIVMLRKRHRTAVVPHVDDLGHAAGLTAAMTPHDHVVDPWTVGIEILPGRVDRSLAKFGERPDRGHVLALVAAPQRKRGPPIAFTRDRPVDVALEPFAEPAVTHVLRIPVDRGVDLEQPVAYRSRADVPRRLGVVEQRRAAPPTMRVGMPVGLLAEQDVALVHVLDQVFVGLLDGPAGEHAHLIGEPTLAVNRIGDLQVVVACDLHVVLAKRGRDVHDPGAVVGRDERRRDDPVCTLKVRERGCVRAADQVGSRKRLEHTPCASQHLLDQRLGHHDVLQPDDDLGVHDVRIDRGGLVGGQRPWRRRPHQHR